MSESQRPSNLFHEDSSQSAMFNIAPDLQRQSSPIEVSDLSSPHWYQSSHKGKQLDPEQPPQTSTKGQTHMTDGLKEDSGDVAGSRFKANETQPQGPGTAGNPSVYIDTKVCVAHVHNTT
jgi:hypothetical protein